jgi:hydrogenase maturation protein HypF
MPAATAIRKRIELRGVVQGVGFRPFVYRIASRYGIGGYVLNSSAGVVIEAEGDDTSLSRFLHDLRAKLPPLARIDEMEVAAVAPAGDHHFSIRESAPQRGAFALVPFDVATCADCARDFTTAGDRRHHYPFTNCTNCGPRYTIIRDVPYDRAATSMAEFPLCAKCRQEYLDPENRRFHAEPNACPRCGPTLTLMTAGLEAANGTSALRRTRDLLQQGAIIAIKGLGGFHLACDAANREAVNRLRERKHRTGKAFAVMTRDLDSATKLAELNEPARDLLTGSRRPIVIMRRRPDAPIVEEVAPGNSTLGVMLPYTPLHHLLFAETPRYDTLVMTSGNLSEEPIVSRNDEATTRLHGIADHFLLHNRAIETRVDDSVVQVFEGAAYPVRRSRGYAPEPVDLHRHLAEVLACGGELKNTFCLTKDHYAILSQHIGDLENIETMDFFRETLHHLRRFFRVSPLAVAHDLHPNYLSTQFALEEAGLPPIGVQHHHAHIASCMADNGLTGPVLGVALDGTGYGADGQIWGGEFLACDESSFARFAHLRYVPLAGGDSAIRQPWRSALAHLDAAFGSDARHLDLPFFHEAESARTGVVADMIERRIQTVSTSSCGRLFDAVASILGVCQEITYEGQAAIELEMIADADDGSYDFRFEETEDGFLIDTRPAIESIVRDVRGGVNPASISARFHRTLANVVERACVRLRDSQHLNRVCLSGGTFQNQRLLRLSVDALRAKKFEVFIHRRVPANDGGLALGQAVIASALLERGAGEAPGAGERACAKKR